MFSSLNKRPNLLSIKQHLCHKGRKYIFLLCCSLSLNPWCSEPLPGSGPVVTAEHCPGCLGNGLIELFFFFFFPNKLSIKKQIKSESNLRELALSQHMGPWDTTQTWWQGPLIHRVGSRISFLKLGRVG